MIFKEKKGIASNLKFEDKMDGREESRILMEFWREKKKEQGGERHTSEQVERLRAEGG
jgi:hypothetical protein